MSEPPETIHVLHVTDDSEFADLTQEFLKREDNRFSIERVTTAKKALNTPIDDLDCIITDYDLPDQNGIQLVKTVRQESKNFPIILFTAEGSESIIAEAIEEGATDYLRKKGSTGRFTILSTRVLKAVENYREEQILSEQGVKFRKLIEGSTDIIVILTETGYFEYLSPSVKRIMGYSPSELIGQNAFEKIHPDDQDEIWNTFQHAVDDPELTPTVEFRYEHADGTWRWLEAHARNLLDDPMIEGFVVNVRDITERKKREDRLNALINSIPDLVFIIDEDGRHIENLSRPEHEPLLVADPDELLGQRLHDVMQPSVADDLLDAINGTLETESSQTIEYPINTDTDTRWLEARISPLQRIIDEKRAVTWIARDITDRKESKQRLERQNKRLDDFVAIVSHDLRNPLNVAKGHLEIIREDTDDDHFAAIARALDRMEALIEDLRTLAQEGKKVNDAKPVDLGEIADRSWQNVDTADATGDITTHQSIRADPGRLKQLLENLIRNAVEHGPDDVRITIDDLEDEAGFYVADNGPGIPEEKRKDVFEAGYSTTRDGTGFGLNIVKEIVDAHSWNIDITESDEDGARFEIRFNQE